MLVVGMLLLTTCFPIPSLDLGLRVVANLKEGEECLFLFFFGFFPKGLKRPFDTYNFIGGWFPNHLTKRLRVGHNRRGLARMAYRN
jgi:hypothetical protein